MLIITRKLGEQITIGDDITVAVIEIKGAWVKLGVAAPKSISVHRQEIYQKIRAQNVAAAAISMADFERASVIIAKTPSRSEAT